jgi:hypothetical protein
MCSDTTDTTQDQLRDGTTTNTIPEDVNQYNSVDGNGNYIYGLMENYTYYEGCKARERNKGIFTADQNVGGRAINTRQNPGGTRYGFECVEERDYYPYWHPSPWKDVAVLVQDLGQCSFYQAESQNVKSKNYCQLDTTGTNNAVPNYENACISAGGKWITVPSWGLPAPDCQLAAFSRDNHLGNTPGGETANYTWTIPSGLDCIATNSCNCALRIRYNITTNESSGVSDDFIDVRNNSIIYNNPTVSVGDGVNLTLALNTAQYGRTFQDRSYMFHIIARPDDVPAGATIYNLNVRGKRGNIVQTFPATEYDFTPNKLAVEEGEYIHFQWTGCDTNPAGNAGEGRVQTDRSNIVQIKSLDNNIPMASTQNKIDNPLFPDPALATRMAYIDQNISLCNPNTNNDQDVTNCKKLNAAPTPYFNGGVVKMSNTGTFFYTSTRNNNFSNRTQKGTIVVTPKKKAASNAVIAGVVLGSVVVVAAAFGGLFFYGKKNPHTAIGRAVDRIPRIPIERYMPSRGAPSSSARREPLLA